MKKFSPTAEAKLKWYVYSLQDVNGKIAYVGKGTGSRVYEHRNSMHENDSIKNKWLRKNEFKEFIHSTHNTSDAAYEAEALLISFIRRYPILRIHEGLLNDVSGHHEIMMEAERYDKLHGDKGEFDKEKVNKLFKKEGRRGAILNIVKSAKDNKRNDIPYRVLSFGFNNNRKEKLHLAEEIFIRFKGSIVEHWKDVKWEYDEKQGNIWFGTKVDSDLAPTRIVGKTRNSQQSVIYLNMDYCYRKNKLK